MKKSLLCGLLATLMTVNAVAQDSQNAPKSDTAQSTQTAVQSVLNSEQKDGIASYQMAYKGKSEYCRGRDN